MQAHVRPVAAASLDRVAQLTQKTNQFNLTLVRRSRDEVQHLTSDPEVISRTLELEDRFANHGLIGVAFVRPDESEADTALVDTLLLSCRVIGRTAETHLLAHLAQAAIAAGFVRLRGVYTPGPKNSLVADVYPRHGFAPHPDREHTWDYDLTGNGAIESVFIADTE